MRLNEANEERAEERARARRCRDEERTAHFMNSKMRTIGVDAGFLDKQLEEKQRRASVEREAREEEAVYQSNLIAHLEVTEAVEQEAKAQEIQDVKQSHLEQMKCPKNNAPKMSDPVILEHCGSSSVQKFIGEDAVREQRTKTQQEQIKQWCAQQLCEKKQKECEKMEENLAYAEYVLAEDEVRGEVARQEAEDRRELTKSVQRYNREQSEEAKLQRMIQLQDEKEDGKTMIAQAQRSTFLSEDTIAAQSALSPHRYRPDHFKGFDPSVVAKVYKENDAVISERRAKEEEEREYENEWAVHQSMMIAKMEEDEMERAAQAREAELKQAVYLEMQRQELKERQRIMNEDRFGEVGVGFFQRFGRSLT